MANEIANYTDILNKTSLGKNDNQCPNKTSVLGISNEIKINGTYTDNQCVLLADIEKEIIVDDSWVIDIYNNSSNTINVMRASVEKQIQPFMSLNENEEIRELIYHINLRDLTEQINGTSLKIRGYDKYSGLQIANLLGYSTVDGTPSFATLVHIPDGGVEIKFSGEVPKMKLNITPERKYSINIWVNY